MRRLALLALALPAAACGAPDDRIPDARDQRIATDEDQSVVFRFDAVDPDGDELTWSAARPGHGTIEVEGHVATYTPAPDFHGTDHVEVTVSDGLRSVRSYVVFDVAAVEDAPRLAPDTFAAIEDEPLSLATYTLLANDVEPDGQPLRLTGVSAIAGGRLELVDDEITFTPAANYTGMARFAYAATDGQHVQTAQVVLRIGGLNDAPIGTGDLLVTTEDTPVAVRRATLLDNDLDPDGDTLIITDVLDASGGEAAIDGPDVRFVPAPDHLGEAGFAYVVSDGRAERLVWVTVVVYPVDDPPVTYPLAVNGIEDELVVIPVSALRDLAHDGDGDPLVVLAVDLPVHGTAALIGDEIRFWPEPDASGMAGFRYWISDGVHDTAGHVVIELEAVDDAPVANPQLRVTRAGVPLIVTMTGHDIDSAALTFAVIDGPRHGTIIPGPTAHSLDYKPEPGFTGEDTIWFVVDADGQVSAPAPITVVVERAKLCGDGVVDPGEACDDGNRIDGDGCDSPCSITACGNGIAASPVVTSATLRWLGATCSGSEAEIELVADGVVLAHVTGGDGDCGCDEPVRSIDLIDGAAIAALSGHALLELRFPGSDSHLAWAELVVGDGATTRPISLYSAGVRLRGEPLPLDLCPAEDHSDVSASIAVVLGEECDDGNLIDGDGCGATCGLEL